MRSWQGQGALKEEEGQAGFQLTQ